MLDGTKHEKAVLVVLAYIIGITSGFIAFGISNIYQNPDKKLQYNTEMSLSLPDVSMVELENLGATPEVEGSKRQSEIEGDSVYYRDGQLSIPTKDGAIVLSVHVDMLGDSVPETLVVQGHHIQPPVFLASPEGRYVYFCEQHIGSKDCINLLFDKEAVTIQYVRVENKALITPASMAASAFWAVNGLNIGDYASESSDEPWSLVEKSEEVQ